MKKGVDYIGVGCGAVILNEKNQILLMKRSKNCRNKAGFWSMPGGGVKYGETFKEAIKREVEEETGLIIEAKKLLSLADDIIPEENQHWITPQYLCEIIGGELKNGEEHKCDFVGWFDLDDLPQEQTYPTIVGIENLKKFQNKGKK